ncbi:hypothetical protein BKA93DRAFT_750644 [Sparassis latifolia]
MRDAHGVRLGLSAVGNGSWTWPESRANLKHAPGHLITEKAGQMVTSRANISTKEQVVWDRSGGNACGGAILREQATSMQKPSLGARPRCEKFAHRRFKVCHNYHGAFGRTGSSTVSFKPKILNGPSPPMEKRKRGTLVAHSYSSSLVYYECLEQTAEEKLGVYVQSGPSLG